MRPKHQPVEQPVQNHHLLASTTPDLALASANAPIVEYVRMPPLVFPILPCIPAFSCTIGIPTQHSFDPPVRKQISNMHCKFQIKLKVLLCPILNQHVFQSRKTLRAQIRRFHRRELPLPRSTGMAHSLPRYKTLHGVPQCCHGDQKCEDGMDG